MNKSDIVELVEKQKKKKIADKKEHKTFCSCW